MNFDKNHVAHKKSIPAGTRIFRRISLTALKIFLVLLLFCVILGTAAGVGMIKGLIASAPNIDSLSVAPAESATYIYNTGNKPVQKLAESTSNRILVKLDQIPEDLQHAIVAVEDERFYRHHGIDIQGIARAAVIGITSGDFSEGASTITQQLIKNNVFTDSDISVAKNDGSNVVESNEFHNCVVKVEDGVTFQYNKMYPGDQTYVYSIRPNNLEGTVVAPNNYWGSDNPDFSALIDKSRAPNGSVDYFPYYSDVALGTLIYKMVTISEDTVWATPHPNQKVTVLDGATLTLSVPMSLDTVTMREGAQIKSNLADQTGSVTTKSLRFSPDLSGTEWKALGVPLASAVIKNSTEEEISAPSVQNVDNGIWFDNKTPEFVVDESAFGMAGLWAANGDTYTISSEGAFEFKTLEEPAAPTETGTFLMCSNPNTFTITLKQSAYILTADGTSFEQEANPEIKPFQSFVLTDAKTLSTLRSLRIGDGVVTGNQTIEPVDGYYVTTDRGAIVIHTPEPMDVVVIRMNGKVAYRGEVTDGQRIMVPSGIYAVNGQLVRVK